MVEQRTAGKRRSRRRAQAPGPSRTELVLDAAGDAISRIRDARFADGVYCVHCTAEDVVRWGTQHGRQRYRCQHCRRTFSDTTKTPAAYTKRIELWPQHLLQMGRSITATEAARELGVSGRTVERWRIRSAEALASASPVVGGDCVHVWRKWDLLVAVDEQGRGISTMFNYRQPQRQYEAFLRRRVLAGSTILCLDSPMAPLPRATLALGLGFQRATSGVSIERPRAYARAWLQWSKRFRGIEYGHWYRYHAWFDHLSRTDSPEQFVDLCLSTWRADG